MFEIVLHTPEIPPNTGNIIRLAANTGANLHLVEPLGFDLSDRQLNRAGLDYHDLARVHVHKSWQACRSALGQRRCFALTTRGSCHFHTVQYQQGDVLVFGAETQGLPETVLSDFAPEERVRVPMCPSNRSMNLSNTVAVVVFEAWRQLEYVNGV